MTLKNYYRRRPQPLVEAEVNGTPVYVLRTNTQQQMESVLGNVFEVSRPAPEPERPADPQLEAMEEAETAITSVLDMRRPSSCARSPRTSAACNTRWRSGTTFAPAAAARARTGASKSIAART